MLLTKSAVFSLFLFACSYAQLQGASDQLPKAQCPSTPNDRQLDLDEASEACDPDSKDYCAQYSCALFSAFKPELKEAGLFSVPEDGSNNEQGLANALTRGAAIITQCDETPSESVPDDIAGAGSEPSSGDPSEDSGKSLDVQDYTPEDVEEDVQNATGGRSGEAGGDSSSAEKEGTREQVGLQRVLKTMDSTTWQWIGHKYGPGNVPAPPEGSLLRGNALAGLPLQAQDFAQSLSNGPDGLAPKEELDLRTEIDEESLKFILLGMVSGNVEGSQQQSLQAHKQFLNSNGKLAPTSVQKYVCQNYMLPDVEFVHPLGSVRGRSNFYHAFRCANNYADYEITLRDIFWAAGDDRCCVWVDMKVKSTMSTLMSVQRIIIPSIILVYFKRDPADGRMKLALQHDNMTVNANIWRGGLWAAQVHESLIRPTMGLVLLLQGTAFDWVKGKIQGVRMQVFGLQPPPSKAADLQGMSVDACMRAAVAQLAQEGKLVGPDSTKGYEVQLPYKFLRDAVGLFAGLGGLFAFAFSTALSLIAVSLSFYG